MSDQQHNPTEPDAAQATRTADADGPRPAVDENAVDAAAEQSADQAASPAEEHPSPESNDPGDVAAMPQVPLDPEDLAVEAEGDSPPTGESDAEQASDDAAEQDADEEQDAAPEAVEPAAAATDEAAQDDEVAEDADAISMDWYILKVQSNRERSIADALRRKIAIEGLDEYFGEVVVPTEKVTEFKGGKKKVVQRKLYPGYIVVHMHINDDTWFAVRETSGIGDFTGAGGKPTPMLPHEVARIIQTDEEETDETPKLDIKFAPGDSVKVKEGTFEGFEGEVNEIDPQSGKVKVLINIFGRSTPVELEYWQVEST